MAVFPSLSSFNGPTWYLFQGRRKYEQYSFHWNLIVVPTLCESMNCSMPGFPILYHFLEFAQIHVHWVGDAIQPSHSLLPLPSPPAFNVSQHDAFPVPVSRLFASGGQSFGALAILRCSAFFKVQLSHPYMTTGTKLGIWIGLASKNHNCLKYSKLTLL